MSRGFNVPSGLGGVCLDESVSVKICSVSSLLFVKQGLANTTTCNEGVLRGRVLEKRIAFEYELRTAQRHEPPQARGLARHRGPRLGGLEAQRALLHLQTRRPPAPRPASRALRREASATPDAERGAQRLELHLGGRSEHSLEGRRRREPQTPREDTSTHMGRTTRWRQRALHGQRAKRGRTEERKTEEAYTPHTPHTHTMF